MVTYLLDTNVVSETRKRRVNANVSTWLAPLQTYQLFLSVLVLGEIRMGIGQLQRRDPIQADMLERWLVTLHGQYSGRILPVTAEVAEEWARMNVPDPVPIIDGLMAATAKVHDLTFVTRDVSQFEQRGVRMLNPFDGPRSS